ncbi:hypothetical protein FH972_000786 [Carpinus fangiana]|uniref:Uncharacterized protein n=1 Tax=Carpinus fangiana TaxID=176857 RepID=A0A5N6Q9X9_9ROSI|nr:hypothetical protein FH972_000786 [Carpinus fangiana]
MDPKLASSEPHFKSGSGSLNHPQIRLSEPIPAPIQKFAAATEFAANTHLRAATVRSVRGEKAHPLQEVSSCKNCYHTHYDNPLVVIVSSSHLAPQDVRRFMFPGTKPSRCRCTYTLRMFAKPSLTANSRSKKENVA